MGNIELNTNLIRGVDEGMLARVTSIGRMMTFGACAIGWAVGGILAQVNARHAVGVLFVMTMALPALAAATSRPLRPSRPGLPEDSIQDNPVPVG